jgi:S1-C subfamily serine protease
MYRIHPATLTAIALLLSATAAAGQATREQDSVEVRITRSTKGFGAEIDRLARELVDKRQMQVTLSQVMRQLQAQIQSMSSDIQRSQSEQALRQIRTRYELTTREGARLRKRLVSLCSEEKKPKGWLGVAVDGSIEFTRDDDGTLVRRYLDYPTVVSVEPGSPGEKGGIRAGDQLLVIAGQTLRGRDFDLSSLLRPGTQLAIRVRRGVETRSMTIHVEPRPDDYMTPCPWVDESLARALGGFPGTYEFSTPEPAPSVATTPEAPEAVRTPMPRVMPRAEVAPMVQPVLPARPTEPVMFAWSSSAGASTIAGAQVVALGRDLGEAFGTDRGVLVLKVLRGTASEESGLRGGDVILKANGVEISEPAGLQRAIRRAADREVELVLIRKKKQIELSLKW